MWNKQIIYINLINIVLTMLICYLDYLYVIDLNGGIMQHVVYIIQVIWFIPVIYSKRAKVRLSFFILGSLYLFATVYFHPYAHPFFEHNMLMIILILSMVIRNWIQNLIFCVVVLSLHSFLCVLEGMPIPFQQVGLMLIFSILLSLFLERNFILERGADRLEKLAFKDSLTNLLNRHYLQQRLKEKVANNEAFALISMDLDGFKEVNDTYGHAAGDELLRIVAGRLVSASMAYPCTVTRQGGDEFIIVYDIQPSHNTKEEVEKLVKKIIVEIEKDMELNGTRVTISTSVGIAFFPENSTLLDEVEVYADLAMYEAKRKGEGLYYFFEKSMLQKDLQRKQIERDVLQALANNELELYYQPQLEKETGVLGGMEALIRWNHPMLGYISPLLLIDVLEESDLIYKVGRWVIRKACEDLLLLQELGHHTLRISVNVSLSQFEDENFVEDVKRIVEEVGIVSCQLTLEITERIFTKDLEKILRKMKELKEYGIFFSLDDFGTRYSTIYGLHQLPIDEVKLSQDFLSKEIERSDVFIHIISAVAEQLNLLIVIEGVETAEQVEMLREQDVHYLQGYYFSPPIPIKAVIEKFGTIEG